MNLTFLSLTIFKTSSGPSFAIFLSFLKRAF
jgi:hypothetical protein